MTAPAINESADIAFEGDTDEPNGGRGVWFADFSGAAYTVSKIAQEGDVVTRSVPGFSEPVPATITLDVPPSSDTFEGFIGFSKPVIDNAGRVSFISSIEMDQPASIQGDAVLWQWDEAGAFLSLVAGAPFRKPTTDGDGGAAFYHRWFNEERREFFDDYAAFSHIAMPLEGDGTLAWYANLGEIGPSDQSDLPPFDPVVGDNPKEGGMFFGSAFNSHAEIVRYQDQVPSVSGVSYGILPVPPDTRNFLGAPTFNKHGDAAFMAFTSDGRNVLTAFDSSSGRRLIAIDDEALPGRPSNHDARVAFAPAINQTGAVAFRAISVDPMAQAAQWGLWAEDASLTLSPLVFATDPVPNFPSANWQIFGDPVMNKNFEKAFVAQHERDVNGETVSTHGVYRASAANQIERVAEQRQLTPLVPNSRLLSRHVGEFEIFADPLMNDSGNVAFLARVHVTDSTLRANLDSLTINPALIAEEGIFFQDNDGVLRTIVASGMTVDDLLGNADTRVIIDLRFSSDNSQYLQSPVREGNGSGHQDGRRTGITNTKITIDDDPPSTLSRVAFTAVLATPGDDDPDNLSEGVFVAELIVTDVSGGSGGECENCLECIEIDCPFGGMLLGLGPDFDQSGLVDDTDVELMMLAMGLTKGRFDMNKDGVVGEKDLVMLLDDYGKEVKQ